MNPKTINEPLIEADIKNALESFKLRKNICETCPIAQLLKRIGIEFHSVAGGDVTSRDGSVLYNTKDPNTRQLSWSSIESWKYSLVGTMIKFKKVS